MTMSKDTSRLTILAVDDTPANIDVVKGVLSGRYFVQAAVNGLMALKIIERHKPDLILLDIMMPGMDGYEVCQKLKADEATRDIPVIFLTAKAEVEDETRGLELGAVDYITKPISPPILIERVKTHLELKSARDFLKRQNEILEEKVIERTRQMEELQDVTMVAMGSLAEARDPETGNHIRRTQRYVKLLAQKLKDHPRFSHFLTPENITWLYKSAPLHDIGKVGVADHILLKPGKLTDEEFDEMKKHTTYGRDAISAAEQNISVADNFLVFAKEIAYAHQEKWNGSGYPEGLAGDDIPIAARLMAVGDVYDALVSRRVYKPPFPHEKAVAIILEGKGEHFDPDMVDAFMEIADEYYVISQEYADSEEAVKAKAGIS
ncbi:two-component system response regulator [Shewanella canadensis]|uniref:Two-component system response regulator n=2 Tax=Shewanella canadensis TaxID=271096 RepID=A0A3S0ILG4_9GAMM|nr:two-component system response regulator [Shewanella canadensis]RTR37883.1 two-component system response regulator [Shewanella canadensis]